jgi:hypothetical protein
MKFRARRSPKPYIWNADPTPAWRVRQGRKVITQSHWVAAQTHDRCYGGSEEGGWWWNYAENLTPPYRFKTKCKATKYLTKIRRRLPVRLHKHGQDWPDLSSVNASADQWAGIIPFAPRERLCSGGYC